MSRICWRITSGQAQARNCAWCPQPSHARPDCPARWTDMPGIRQPAHSDLDLWPTSCAVPLVLGLFRSLCAVPLSRPGETGHWQRWNRASGRCPVPRDGNRYGAGTASAYPSDRCGGSAQKICQRKVLDKRCASGQLALLTSAAPSMLLARVSLRTVKTSHSDDVDGSGRGDAEPCY